MPRFAYTARDAEGRLVEGVLDTSDSGSAASDLFRRGFTPVDITVTASPAARSRPLFQQLFRERIRDVDLMMFSRQMYTLLKAGVPIMAALSGLQRSTSNTEFARVICLNERNQPCPSQ